MVLSPAPGLVQFSVTSSSNTEVVVMWSPPSQSGGVITTYEVMYQTYEKSGTIKQIRLAEYDRSYTIQSLST